MSACSGNLVQLFDTVLIKLSNCTILRVTCLPLVVCYFFPCSCIQTTPHLNVCQPHLMQVLHILWQGLNVP